MTADYLMYCTTALYFTCFLPELYATYKNKNANVYNIPEKALILLGTSMALSYAVINNNIPLMTNYAPLLIMDILTLSMKLYYARQNKLYSSPPAYDSCEKQHLSDSTATLNTYAKLQVTDFISDTSKNVDEIIDMLTIVVEK